MKSIDFVGGTLAGFRSPGKVFFLKDADGPSLLFIGQRELMGKTTFGVLLDDGTEWVEFCPGKSYAQGDPMDVAYISTQPLSATARVAVRAHVDGQTRGLGAYHVGQQSLTVRDNEGPWTLVREHPLHIRDMKGSARQSELAVLLENFRCARNVWPRLRDPWLTTNRNAKTPIPGVELRKRVTGPVAAESDPDGARFLDSGYDHLKLVLRIAEVYGAQFSPGFAILDWGVGCGRIARHMPRELQPRLVGIDVDPVNIRWCRENLPFGRYERIDPYAQTAFDSGTFDLIYSHSVLTHLGEQDQFLWLKELGRLSRGLIILSVHGLFSAQTANWAKKEDGLWDYLMRGFRDSGRENPDICDVVPAGYYRGVAHTPAYIVANWNRHLQVIDIVPGGFGNLHDAVICRPHAR